ncbi:hypothetical protein S40285_05093 [Stachybotrys chlorohalonatus IBT 40285]|uniref:Uncharacterized protein n=1 Tax=Stachybotrys chlorohalonatus (strain IBT 40285) TaxID=1283841 RepID=A0A084QQJ5_STAC4|nr:hypothetical protein S40285_05093 [Stachybotrys chlorohalonata IBT 40285]
MTEKEVIFITGANAGLGYEAVRSLLQSSKAYHVLLGSRDVSRGEEAAASVTKEFPESKSTVEVIQIDISEDESINKAVETITSKFGRLDALVNNAGVSLDSMNFTDDLTNFRRIFNDTWNVNVTGTHILTAGCAPLLLAAPSPRLIFMTSGLSSLSNRAAGALPSSPPQPGWPKERVFPGVSYAPTKAGLNMVMLSWHGMLQGDGVKIWAISPGFLVTGLMGKKEVMKNMGAGEPWLGGDIIKRVLEGERDADVGKVVGQDGRVQPW